VIIVKTDSVPPVLLHYTPDVADLIKTVDDILHTFNLHAFVTSGMEGTHKRASKHYDGKAVDFRVNWGSHIRADFFSLLSKAFGSRMRYILETDHLHTETV